MNKLALFLTICFTFLLISNVYSEQTKTILVSFQGKLTNNNGTIIKPASMRLKIKNSTGSVVWGPYIFNNVTDYFGIFNLLLGAKHQLNLIPGQEYNLIVELDKNFGIFKSADVIFGDGNPLDDLIKFVCPGVILNNQHTIYANNWRYLISSYYNYTISPPKGGKLIFVTEDEWNGSLGGLSGADAKCQIEAEKYSFPGTYKAWLSTSKINAKDHALSGDYAYYCVENHPGTETPPTYHLIAKNNADLLDGTLDYNYFCFPNGTKVRFPRVRTGTLESGLKANSGDTWCYNWTSGYGSYADIYYHSSKSVFQRGAGGNFHAASQVSCSPRISWTDSQTYVSGPCGGYCSCSYEFWCSTKMHLYCFQQ